MHRARRKERKQRNAISISRFEPTPDGFLAFREASKRPLAENSEKKWMPRIRELEQLRDELFEARWSEIDPEEIAFVLMERVYEDARGRGGAAPSSNTLRGRYDAAYAYFDFLLLIKALYDDRHPLDFLGRPSSKAKDKPVLEEDEDWKLAALDLEGHEQAVYTLARSNLREGEISELEDSDVDLVNAVITIRDGKTKRALRRVPLYPQAVRRLREYRLWRDDNVPAARASTNFVCTRSGGISPAYTWKLIKAIGVRAELRMVYLETSDGSAIRSSEITPHTLRRTWGADLVRRDVPTVVFFPTYGHRSKRVTEESYAIVSHEHATRKILQAGDGGPLASPSSIFGQGRAPRPLNLRDPGSLRH